MNKVTIIGRVVRDIDLKYTSSNTAVTKFTLAVDRKFTKEGEAKQADFINCTAFAKTAEFISNHFHKGKQMALCGRIQTGSYEKDGIKVYTTDVIVEDVYFTGTKSDSGNSDNSSKPTGFDPIEVSDNELPF
jgi:single-strand DNA-binding protein